MVDVNAAVKIVSKVHLSSLGRVQKLRAAAAGGSRK